MKEAAVQFGADRQLVGILTTPSDDQKRNVACVLLNAGVIHRTGPHRINVRVARALADNGVISMRFDLSGLGDSSAARGTANFWDQAVTDLRAALDFVETNHQIHRFVVIGLCSGAVNGYRLALVDSRVTGLLMFDGFTYPTPKTGVIRRWKRFQTMSWISFFRHVAAKMKGAAVRPFPSKEQVTTMTPTKDEFRAAMDALCARGVSVYLMHTPFIELHNYANQLRDAFRGASFLGHVRYQYLPHVDHTLTPVAVQRDFTSNVLSWVSEL
jgi:dienelactone hydrolase